MLTRRVLAVAAMGILAVTAAHGVRAQDYPDKTVRIIVGFPAGSGTDIFARMFADKLSNHFKGRFVGREHAGRRQQ
jgi:tripartite-type tricarboxylate transporter receptor subunit TctC